MSKGTTQVTKEGVVVVRAAREGTLVLGVDGSDKEGVRCETRCIKAKRKQRGKMHGHIAV